MNTLLFRYYKNDYSPKKLTRINMSDESFVIIAINTDKLNRKHEFGLSRHHCLNIIFSSIVLNKYLRDL